MYLNLSMLGACAITMGSKAPPVQPPGESGNIHMAQHGGNWWNAVTINGRTYLLRKLGGYNQVLRP